MIATSCNANSSFERETVSSVPLQRLSIEGGDFGRFCLATQRRRSLLQSECSLSSSDPVEKVERVFEEEARVHSGTRRRSITDPPAFQMALLGL